MSARPGSCSEPIPTTAWWLSPWRVSWSRRQESELVWGMHAVVTGPWAGLAVWAGWALQGGPRDRLCVDVPPVCTHVCVHFGVHA